MLRFIVGLLLGFAIMAFAGFSFFCFFYLNLSNLDITTSDILAVKLTLLAGGIALFVCSVWLCAYSSLEYAESKETRYRR